MEDKTPAHADRPDSKDHVFELNFVPQWARKPAGEGHYRQKDYRDEGRTERPRRPQQDRQPRPERPRAPQAPAKELPLQVTFLPEQKRLASLVRQIHHSRRAYPLMDLANLLIHDAAGYLVKIEVEKNAEDFKLYQCKRCKAVATSKERMEQHVAANHLSDLYEKEEIETEPPAGQFTCVARCTKTGTLLGPPNHHSYAGKLNELHQSRFAHLSLEEFKRSIETVQDEALIEQWKQENTKKTVYQLKSDPAAEPVDLRKAELGFMKKIPALYEETPRAIVPAKVAQGIEDRDITHAIRSVWAKESHFPLTMSFSMRAAFRHMHLHLFKAGKINFVTHIKPRPILPDETIDSIAEVLLFLKDHPGSTRGNLLEVLHPSIDPNSKAAQEALQPLSWLVERGHIIEFFNGTLSVPLGHRSRRP